MKCMREKRDRRMNNDMKYIFELIDEWVDCKKCIFLFNDILVVTKNNREKRRARVLDSKALKKFKRKLNGK